VDRPVLPLPLRQIWHAQLIAHRPRLDPLLMPHTAAELAAQARQAEVTKALAGPGRTRHRP